MLALPMSPLLENLMPSFVTDMSTVSPMVPKSLPHDSAPLNFTCTSARFHCRSRARTVFKHPCFACQVEVSPTQLGYEEYISQTPQMPHYEVCATANA